jgi:hypothetical protein
VNVGVRKNKNQSALLDWTQITHTFLTDSETVSDIIAQNLHLLKSHI